MNTQVERRRNELLGKEFETNNCGKCVVVEYNSSKDVLVQFIEHHYLVKCQLDNLKRGNVNNPYAPTFYGKGYIGVGDYSLLDKKCFGLWTNMLKRAYSDKFKDEYPTYKGVTVCDDWLNFQNFAGWYYSQKYHDTKDHNGKSYHLDKDILVKGNKVYSPETCCFVPNKINSTLLVRKASRGNYPIGVYYDKKLKRFLAKLSLGADNSCKHLGCFETVEDAFLAYKVAKESYVKELAESWKDKVDSRVYQALVNHEIKITD